MEKTAVSWTRSRKLNNQLFIGLHQHINALITDTWKTRVGRVLKWPSAHKTARESSEVLQRQTLLHLHAGGTGLTWNAEMKVVRRAHPPHFSPRSLLTCQPTNEFSFGGFSLIFQKGKKEMKMERNLCLCMSWHLTSYILRLLLTCNASKEVLKWFIRELKRQDSSSTPPSGYICNCTLLLVVRRVEALNNRIPPHNALLQIKACFLWVTLAAAAVDYCGDSDWWTCGETSQPHLNIKWSFRSTSELFLRVSVHSAESSCEGCRWPRHRRRPGDRTGASVRDHQPSEGTPGGIFRWNYQEEYRLIWLVTAQHGHVAALDFNRFPARGADVTTPLTTQTTQKDQQRLKIIISHNELWT